MDSLPDLEGMETETDEDDDGRELKLMVMGGKLRTVTMGGMLKLMTTGGKLKLMVMAWKPKKENA